MKLANTLLTIFVLAAPAFAGPPLICHSYVIGNDATLPAGTDKTSWNNPDPKYDTRMLATDTLRILDSGKPLLTRMETLRRAAVYTARDKAAGMELFSQLMARALASELKGQNDSLALFDAGYFAESLKQLSHVTHMKSLSDLDGYDWVKRSLPGLQDKLTAEYAMGLMKTHDAWPNEHMRRAIAGAQEGTLLAQNLRKHFENQTFAELKRSVAVKSAAR